MKSIFKLSILATFLLMFQLTASAQTSRYDFTSGGSTYSEITGGTVINSNTGADDNIYENNGIGFTFNFNGNDYSTICIGDNGFITFGNSLTMGYFYPYFDNTFWDGYDVVSAFYSDLQAQANAEIRMQTTGSSPNRVTTIQWKGYRQYGGSNESYNFQIKLFEYSNRVSIVYGSFTVPTSLDWTPQVGIKGVSSDDFRIRYVELDYNTWATSEEGSSVSDYCYVDNGFTPSSGQTYSWSLADYSVTTLTSSQNTISVQAGAQKQQVIGVAMEVSGYQHPLNLTNLAFNTTGTTNVAEISNARLFTTGTSNVFAATTQFGSTVAAPNGAFSFSSTSNTFSDGTYYFWLTYDVASNATSGNVIDAQCTQITAGGTNYTPNPTSPAGSRTVVIPMAGNYTVGTGGTYNNLLSAFTDINNRGLSANVNLQLISSTNEASSAIMNKWQELGIGGYSISIKPTIQNCTVSGSAPLPIVIFNGVKNVTIDGSYTANGTTRDLTIVNNGADVAKSGGIIAVGSTNITIKNANILAGASANSYCILFTTDTTVQVNNCSISRANTGIGVQGNSYNINISNNQFGISGQTNALQRYGIYFNNNLLDNYSLNTTIPNTSTINSGSNYTISGNNISNMYNTTGAFSMQAIRVMNGYNGIIEKNTIHSMYNSVSGAYALDIRDPANPTPGSGSSHNYNLVIKNNYIYDITTTASYLIGITTSGVSGVSTYHNTFILTGTCPSIGAVYFINPYDCKNLNFANNICINKTVCTSGAYGVYVSGQTATVVDKLDFNCYDISPASGNAYIGLSSSNAADLAAWQLLTTKEGNSLSQAVSFVGTNDYHLNGSSVFNLLADTVDVVSTDLDGELRRSAKTNMGCDEVNPILSVSLPITQFGSTVFCPGENINLSFGASIQGFRDGVIRLVNNPPYTYLWYKDGATDPIADKDGKPITTETLQLKDVYEKRDRGTYNAEGYLLGSRVTSLASIVTIETPISITGQLFDRDVCVGDAALNLSITTAGTILGEGDYTESAGYQWQRSDIATPNNFVDLPGETKSTYTLLIANADQARGNYRVKVMGPGNCGASQLFSNAATIAVAEPLVNQSMTPVDFDPGYVCNGSTIQFSATAGGTIKGYRWQYAKDNIAYYDIDPEVNPTAAQQVLTITDIALTASGSYRAIVLGSADCGTPEGITNASRVTVWPYFDIMEHPASKVICAGESVVLNVIPDGTVIDSDHPYQWQRDGVDIDIKKNPTAGTPILIMDNISYDASGEYRCVVHYEDCRGKGYMSTNVAQVYVLRTTKIVRQPISQLAELGATVTYDFDAHVYDYPPDFQPTIQWYKGTLKLTDALQSGKKYAGSNSSILSIKNVQAADLAANYYVVITGRCGTDSSAKVALGQMPHITITSQPVAVEVCEGGQAQLQLAATIAGTLNPPTYQWYKDGVKLSNNADISGADIEQLTINNLAAKYEGSYYCVISVASVPGLDVYETTIPVTITVKKLPVITPPTAGYDVTVETGKTLTLDITAVSSSTLSYQWQKDGTDIAGETNPTFSIASASINDAGSYTCKVTNECGTVTSVPFAVTVTLLNQSGVDSPAAGGFTLLLNQPNPFHRTVISFIAPNQANVRLTLTDIFGREVAVLLNNTVNAGLNSVDVDANKLNLSSGVYYYTLSTQGFASTKQLVVVK